LATGNPIIVELDIYELLEAGGYFTGWSSFVGIMPDKGKETTYDNCISVCNYSGISTQTNYIQRPNFQVLVRADDYYSGRYKIQELLDFLMNFDECLQKEFTINGHHYTLLIALSTAPNDLGIDKRERYLFSINFNAIVEHSDYVLVSTTNAVLFGTTGDVLYGTTSGAIDA